MAFRRALVRLVEEKKPSYGTATKYYDQSSIVGRVVPQQYIDMVGAPAASLVCSRFTYIARDIVGLGFESCSSDCFGAFSTDCLLAVHAAGVAHGHGDVQRPILRHLPFRQHQVGEVEGDKDGDKDGDEEGA